jgi:predicted nuclease of predicted toxin-antitoxin system
MRFLVDAQLPPALARWQAANGHTAEHVGDVGLHTKSDTAIWDYAIRQTAVIITKDEDFAQRKALAQDGPVVIWVRLPNTRRGALLAWSATVMPMMVSALERGDTLIELI